MAMKKIIFYIAILVTVTACETYTNQEIYRFHRGVRAYNDGNYKAAIHDFRLSGEVDGNCLGMFEYARLTHEGWDGTPNKTEARKAFIKAAEMGEIRAMAILANFYSYGEQNSEFCKFGCGVKKDKVQAYKWIALTDRYVKTIDNPQGKDSSQYKSSLTKQYKYSPQRVSELKSALTASELAIANQQIESWPHPIQACHLIK